MTGEGALVEIGRPRSGDQDRDFHEDSRIRFSELENAYDLFAVQNDFIAKVLFTGTFRRDPDKRITVERTEYLWRLLVRRLNEAAGGKNYQRKWGHSYFGYIFGMDVHKDGVFHCHAVIDNWVDFKMVHELWQRWAGWAGMDKTKDSVHDTKYVLKYVVKSDRSPTFFFQKNRQLRNHRTGMITPSARAPG